MMDINTLRSLSTVLVAVAFVAICWWAFSPSRRKRFEEAARLPFADEPNENKLNENEDVLNEGDLREADLSEPDLSEKDTHQLSSLDDTKS
jgi:cytochrome c oxidase cbb3-type subunit 4